MTDKPLNSGDQSKIIIFILLFLPSIPIGVGVIPAIFLIFGIFMMKKNEDFSYLETSVKIFKGYIFLGLLVLICFFFTTLTIPRFLFPRVYLPSFETEQRSLDV